MCIDIEKETNFKSFIYLRMVKYKGVYRIGISYTSIYIILFGDVLYICVILWLFFRVENLFKHFFS